MKKRATLIVLDSVGIGALKDAKDFGDAGAHTLGHIYQKTHMAIPNMLSLGLGNIENSLVPASEAPKGCYGRSEEKTRAKDTTSGHWEMAGVIMEPPFRTYPNGFPKSVIEEFEKKTGRGTLGNYVASGTEIIQVLGDEHCRTGKLIVYTSADSVFQIAAHEDVVPIDELYRCCEIARSILMGDELVGRVIARPFTGGNGKYTRTENRRDYAIPPVSETILDSLTESGYTVAGVGKIEDIFCKRGLGLINHTKNNHDGVDATISFLKDGKADFIFTNLVDFDMLYGHRNDAEGYARALEYFDKRLPEIMACMHEGDIMIITADHGCDPTYPGTDHTREYIPIVVWGPSLKGGVSIGTRKTFADIGSSIVEHLTGKPFCVGESFLPLLK